MQVKEEIKTILKGRNYANWKWQWPPSFFPPHQDTPTDKFIFSMAY